MVTQGGGTGSRLGGRVGAFSLVLFAVALAPPALAQEAHEPFITAFDIGLSYDDNVARAKEDEPSLADHVLNVGLHRRAFYPAGTNTRWVVVLSAGADVHLEYKKLSRAFGSAKLEFQYRPSAGFGAPTLGLFAQVAGDHYDSVLRRGYRVAGGASVVLPITDRIQAFAAVSRTERDARSRVFEGGETSLRVNLDYAVSRSSTLYLGAEYRRGDIVSSGPPSLANLNIAKWLVQDDAFAERQYFAYRFEGRTAIASVGYNVALGANEALDFALRQAVSEPDDMPGFAGAVRSQYEVRQFFVSYLKNF
jgi:hypothetical protein